MCAENLKTILKVDNEAAVSKEDVNLDIQYLNIVNQKSVDGNNYLHFLINKISDKNEKNIFESIKLLLLNGCNPKTQNNQLESPFDILRKTSDHQKSRQELVDYFIKQSFIDFHSNDRVICLTAQNDGICTDKPVRDVSYMLQLIAQFNENKFIRELKTFINFHGDVFNFLEQAILRDLWKIVEAIVDKRVDVNQTLNYENLQPAFLACRFGHHRCLEVLLRDPKLRLKNGKQNILHQLLKTENIASKDRQKCFDFIVADWRCSDDIINGTDETNQPPLFYACHNSHHEIVKNLLRHGAFIGHASIINNIDKDDLKEFLDENIKCCGSVKDKKCEIQVNFKFLADAKSSKEMHPLHLMTANEKLKELILHPVIASYLDLKWKKIDIIVYFNMAIYFLFMIFLGCFVINYFHIEVYNNNGKMSGIGKKNGHGNITEFDRGTGFDDNIGYGISTRFDSEDSDEFDIFKQLNIPNIPVQAQTPISNSDSDVGTFHKPNIISILLFGVEDTKKRSKRSAGDSDKRTDEWNEHFEEHIKANLKSYRFCVAGFSLMVVYEIIQFFVSYKTYFFKVSNWLDISLIFFSYAVLLGSFDFDASDFKRVRATMILIMAAQTIQLVARVSFLSMSLHMAIFKKVCKTFLKTIALYLILILAFAMSFYTMNDKTGDIQTDKPSNESDKDIFSDPFMSVITTVRMMLSDFENIEIDSNDHFQGALFLLFVVVITVILFNLLNALAISDTHDIIKDAELVDAKKRISILFSYERLFYNLDFNYGNIFPDLTKIVITPNQGRIVKVKPNTTNNKKENVVISIHKTCNIRKTTKYVAKHKKYYFTGSQNMKLDGDIIDKIRNHINERQ